MINPKDHTTYLSYLLACKWMCEPPLDEAAWRSRCKPMVTELEAPTLEQRVKELERRMNEWEAGK